MNRLVLHRVFFKVKSHDYGIDLSDVQSGYLLPSVKTPLRKKRMTGKLLTKKKSTDFSAKCNKLDLVDMHVNNIVKNLEVAFSTQFNISLIMYAYLSCEN